MDNQPLVSIVTTFYNSVKLGDFVNRSMDCLLNQTYKNIEFVCVNDGSQDQTLEQLKAYAEKDSRIIIVDKENEGVAQYAKAAGQAVAKGDWVMLFDHDDLISHDGIEQAVKTAKEHPELDAVTFMKEVLYADGKIRSYHNLDIVSKEKLTYEFRKLAGEDVFQKTVGRYSVHFRGIMKAEKFKAVSFRYPEKLVNGDEIVERLIFRNLDFMGSCSAIYKHFIYSNSSAKSYSLKKIDIVRTDVILRELFKKEAVYEARKDIFELAAFKSLIDGVKIYHHLKNTTDEESKQKYFQFLRDGYANLDRKSILSQSNGIQKIYNSLILTDFSLMMNFYKFKK